MNSFSHSGCFERDSFVIAPSDGFLFQGKNNCQPSPFSDCFALVTLTARAAVACLRVFAAVFGFNVVLKAVRAHAFRVRVGWVSPVGLLCWWVRFGSFALAFFLIACRVGCAFDGVTRDVESTHAQTSAVDAWISSTSVGTHYVAYEFRLLGEVRPILWAGVGTRGWGRPWPRRRCRRWPGRRCMFLTRTLMGALLECVPEFRLTRGQLLLKGFDLLLQVGARCVEVVVRIKRLFHRMR